MISKYKFILASESPRRKELLSKFIKDFEIRPVNIDETPNLKLNADCIALDIAQRKSDEAIKSLKDPMELVITSDTTVITDEVKSRILGKPKDENDAINMLQILRGNKHFVNTAVVCRNLDNSIDISISEISTVEFYNLSDKIIKWYIDQKEYIDKAGAYGIQGKASIFVKEIIGNYDNIVGFPISKFMIELLLNKIIEINQD